MHVTHWMYLSVINGVHLEVCYSCLHIQACVWGGGGGHSTSSNSNSDFFFFVIDYMDENMLQYGGVCMGFWVNKSSKCVFIILCNNQSF